MSYYSKKSWSTLVREERMIKKFSPPQAHVIVKDYVKILAWEHSTFSCVKDLLNARNISRNAPSKLKKKFDLYWSELHEVNIINYDINVFLERSKLRKHRTLPDTEEYKRFVSIYPRWWYQTYVGWCEQQEKIAKLKEWMFYYYKDATKQETNSSAPNNKKRSSKISAKDWYRLLYKKYDLVVHIDWKSMEDQENIWKNPRLKFEVKRLTLAVEAWSWITLGIWVERSHNKSNAMSIFKQICEQVKVHFGEDKKICFVTDAGSEYVNNKDLRWIDITDKDTGKLATYLAWLGHGRRITRRPEDNSFVENKNDYIERACLDNREILTCNSYGLMCLLDEFIERNNRYLRWSKKSFRGKWITPEENIQQRFGIESWRSRVAWFHVQSVEKQYKLSDDYRNIWILGVLKKLQWHTKTMKRQSKNCFFYTIGSMHPKSLDSSICWLQVFFSYY